MYEWTVFTLFSITACIEINLDTNCPITEVPFSWSPKCKTEEIILLEEVYASTSTKKGVYQILNNTLHYQQDNTVQDHVSLLIYPTDLDICEGECGIIQRIDNAGKLMTPQLYTNQANQLFLLIYGFGAGRILTFDRKLKSYTWQEIIVSLSKDYVRICVNSLYDTHCRQYMENIYEYNPNGAWIIGGSHHKKGMPGFITDVRIIPGSSHSAQKYSQLGYSSRKLRYFTPPIRLPVSEICFMCRAYQIDSVTNVLRLSDSHFYTPENRYTPYTKCPSSLHHQIHAAVVRRTVTESLLVYNHVRKHFDCSDTKDTAAWLKDEISKMRQSTLPEDMRSRGRELLLTSHLCNAVLLLIQSSCHGNPDILFSLASFLNTGVILQQNALLAYELTMVAATQRSVLANSALAFNSSKCHLKYAYYGVVAEKYMEAWKEASSDLISDRVRLHNGELGQNDGESDQVFQFLLMQAQQGNAEAQANVGRMYYWGQGGVQRNAEEAFNMQQAAAHQNHPDALFDTGVMLMKGHGVSQNNTKAKVFLEKAAKVGHKSALGTLGYMELNEKHNITGAVHYFNKSHHLGDTDATHNLAVIQSFYHVFDKDPYYAHNMFKLAAERGHRDAAMMAAEQTLQGFKDIPGNCNVALTYIKMISDSSNIVTRKMREGCKHFQNANYDQAALQYLILAESGVEMADYNLAWLCEQFSSEMTLKIPDCVTRYYKMSAELGYGPSQSYYANYLWGLGRYYEAARWYSRAAQLNEAEGMYGLGYFAKEGIGAGVLTVNSTQYYFAPQVNISLARELWAMCIKMGTEDAIFGCGISLISLLCTNISFFDVLEILLPYSLAVTLVAMLISKFSHRTFSGDNLSSYSESENEINSQYDNVIENRTEENDVENE